MCHSVIKNVSSHLIMYFVNLAVSFWPRYNMHVPPLGAIRFAYIIMSPVRYMHVLSGGSRISHGVGGRANANSRHGCILYKLVCQNRGIRTIRGAPLGSANDVSYLFQCFDHVLHQMFGYFVLASVPVRMCLLQPPWPRLLRQLFVYQPQLLYSPLCYLETKSWV